MKPKATPDMLRYVTGYSKTAIQKIISGDRIDHRNVREAKRKIEGFVAELKKEWETKIND